MTSAINTTEKIYEQDGFIAFVMGVNGTKASGFGETRDEAYDACVNEAGDLDAASIRVEPQYSCSLSNLGKAWNNCAIHLNEQGYDWEFASDNPEEWPVGALGYYANVQTGNPDIFVTGLGSEGAWADPDYNGEAVCLNCIRDADSGTVEGEDEIEEGEEFEYKKLETPGECWSCLQMIRENSEGYL